MGSVTAVIRNESSANLDRFNRFEHHYRIVPSLSQGLLTVLKAYRASNRNLVMSRFTQNTSHLLVFEWMNVDVKTTGTSDRPVVPLYVDGCSMKQCPCASNDYLYDTLNRRMILRNRLDSTPDD